MAVEVISLSSFKGAAKIRRQVIGNLEKFAIESLLANISQSGQSLIGSVYLSSTRGEEMCVCSEDFYSGLEEVVKRLTGVRAISDFIVQKGAFERKKILDKHQGLIDGWQARIHVCAEGEKKVVSGEASDQSRDMAFIKAYCAALVKWLKIDSLKKGNSDG